MKLPFLTLPLLLAGAVLAQEQDHPRPLGQPIEDPFGVPTLAEAHSALRASGRHYEATFQDGRMEFLPVLGSIAPETQSFAFSFVSASRGATTRRAEERGDVRADGLTAIFRRSETISETYEVRPDGLKQSFLFDQEFGGHGDLVVRGRVKTPLPFVGETVDGGLSFVHPTWGGVELGQVVGFDATGAQVTGSMRFEGGELEMTLPASFVDQAVWPITLDPLVGTVLSPNVDQFDSRSPAASSNADGDVLLTFTRLFSLSSAAIRGQRINADGTNNGAVLFLTNESYAVNSSVGFNRQVDNWLVAYEVRASAIAPADVVSRSVRPNGTASQPFAIATGSSNQRSPGVASDGRGSDDECMVVWVDQGSGLRVREVRPLTNGPEAFPTRTLTTDGSDDHPSISQSCGLFGRCMIAFERGNDVRITSVRMNTAPSGFTRLVAFDASNPACDSDGNRGIVTYERPEPGNVLDGDIFARCYNASTLTPLTAERPIDTNVNSDETEPSIAFFGPNALIVYSDQIGTSSTNYGVRGVTVDWELCTRCSGSFGTGRSFDGRQHKAIVTSRLGANPTTTSDDGMFFWLEEDGSNGANGDIYGRRFAATGAGGSSVTIAPGCGLGGTLSTSSSMSLGTDLELNLTGADPGAQAGFLLLREPGTALFGCGPCQVVIPALSTNLPIQNGEFSTTIRIPCDITLNGGRFDWQGAVLFTSQSPCSLLPGGGFSNVLRTTLGL